MVMSTRDRISEMLQVADVWDVSKVLLITERSCLN